MCITKIKEDWAENEKLYKEFTRLIDSRIKFEIEKKSMFARVYSRTKELKSLIKKFFKEKLEDPSIGYEYFENMSDKSGTRIICRFIEEKPQIEEIIENLFEIKKREDFADKLKENTFDYKSIHFDIILKEGIFEDTTYEKFKGLKAEIQLRTICEDAWAEIFHDIAYKPISEIPPEIKRSLFCLGGLLEVADNCFSEANNKIIEGDEIDEFSLLLILESYQIMYTKKIYDKEISHKIIENLIPLLEKNKVKFKDDLDSFVKTNENKIIRIMEEERESSPISLLIYQPEIYLIFFLIDQVPFKIISTWKEIFPIEFLKDVGIIWGKPLSSYVS